MHANLFVRKPEVVGIITMTLNCQVKVLLRNSVSHSYFRVIFRGGWWVVWSCTLSLLLGTSTMSHCLMQLCWQRGLQWGSIFSITITSVHLLWFLSFVHMIHLMTSPWLRYIPLFIPPCTRQMQRWILTCAWCRPTP